VVDATRSLVRWLWRRRTLHRHILEVRAPTLLIHGDHDLVVSLAASEAVASLRPDWDFRVLADTGHVPQLEQPDSFVEVVEGWLDTLQPAAPVPTSSR
jgi:pimeloyl-ACP methyl ester carboxylesterase